MRNRRAFTLIELVAVLLIIALVAGTVMLKVQGPLNSAAMKDVVGAVAGYDRLTRDGCEEQDRPAQVVVDLNAGRLDRIDPASEEPLGAPLVLPAAWSVSRLIMGQQETRAGKLSIPFSRQGLSPSYALLLEGPSGRRQWLVIPGLSGIAVGVENEKEVRDILDAERKGADAG